MKIYDCINDGCEWCPRCGEKEDENIIREHKVCQACQKELKKQAYDAKSTVEKERDAREQEKRTKAARKLYSGDSSGAHELVMLQCNKLRKEQLILKALNMKVIKK